MEWVQASHGIHHTQPTWLPAVAVTFNTTRTMSRPCLPVSTRKAMKLMNEGLQRQLSCWQPHQHHSILPLSHHFAASPSNHSDPHLPSNLQVHLPILCQLQQVALQHCCKCKHNAKPMVIKSKFTFPCKHKQPLLTSSFSSTLLQCSLPFTSSQPVHCCMVPTCAQSGIGIHLRLVSTAKPPKLCYCWSPNLPISVQSPFLSSAFTPPASAKALAPSASKFMMTLATNIPFQFQTVNMFPASCTCSFVLNTGYN